MKWRYFEGYILSNYNDNPSQPAIGFDGTIYVGFRQLLPLRHESWRHSQVALPHWYWVYSSPAIGADGTVYVGSQDYYLYAINPGNTQVALPDRCWCTSSPAIGGDGTVYVGVS